MIRTEGMKFALEEDYEWIFFSSSEGVKHFFNQITDNIDAKLAAIGPGTSKTLSSFGEVLFEGKSNDIHFVAHAFKKKVGINRVLFPVGNKSKRTVQNYLDSQQVVEAICYQTTLAPVAIGFPDILVFSSPSNVESYVLSNQFLPSQKIVAFGESTREALNNHFEGNVTIPENISEEALWEAIKQNLLS